MKKTIKLMVPAMFVVIIFSAFVMNAGNRASENDIYETSTTVVEEIVVAELVIQSLGEFTLTAYCPCVRCCGVWSEQHPSKKGTGYIQKTASGTIPTAGKTIATDTNIIPFGTTVIINGHEYVAEDRGGAIKGNRIDVFFDSHEEALAFGRQKSEVFIKK
jgi:3D (Asp-Asp-Asp) domain-containing protein